MLYALISCVICVVLVTLLPLTYAIGVIILVLTGVALVLVANGRWVNKNPWAHEELGRADVAESCRETCYREMEHGH